MRRAGGFVGSIQGIAKGQKSRESSPGPADPPWLRAVAAGDGRPDLAAVLMDLLDVALMERLRKSRAWPG